MLTTDEYVITAFDAAKTIRRSHWINTNGVKKRVRIPGPKLLTIAKADANQLPVTSRTVLCCPFI